MVIHELIKLKIKQDFPSVRNFALEVGMTPQQLGNFLSGKRGINTNTLEVILEALNLRVDEMFIPK